MNIPEYISNITVGNKKRAAPFSCLWLLNCEQSTTGDEIGFQGMSQWYFRAMDASDFASWISHNKKCSSWWSVLLPQQMILLLWDNRDSGLAAVAGLIQTPSRRLFLPDDAASVISVFTGSAGGLLIKYFFYWDVTRNRRNHICDVDFQSKMANEGLALKWDSRWERIPGALHVLQMDQGRETEAQRAAGYLVKQQRERISL